MPELTISLDPLLPLVERTGHGVPDLLAAAGLAELAGAHAVRVGANEEFRPVRETDLRDLRRAVRCLELRMAPVPSLVKAALETRPERVLLASEAREVPGRASPLDLRAWSASLGPAVRTLEEAGFDLAVLVAPDPAAVKAVHGARATAVELHLGAVVDLPAPERRAALEAVADAARLAVKLRMRVGVGGALAPGRVGEVLAAVPGVERVAVGRAWAARCVLAGVDRATRDLAAAVA